MGACQLTKRLFLTQRNYLNKNTLMRNKYLIKPKTFFVLILFLTSLYVSAYSEKNILQKRADLESVKDMLVLNQKWVPYPRYTNRAAWDSLFSDSKQQMIRNGEKYLNYKWNVIKATDYLEYERTGNRTIMEQPFEENRRALNSLFIAELAEGEGRFLDQLLNGVYFSCETTSWTISAHQGRQSSRRSLPDWREPVIDLTSAGYGMTMSWVYYFFRRQFDKVNPTISLRMKEEIDARILEPFLEDLRSSWWTASRWKPGEIINNWNPWCNSNVLQCFLLMEDDKDRLAEAVFMSMKSVDKFINYVSEDGACEEGPSYWGHAAGKLYDYLQVLKYATDGKIDLFDEVQIKNMGEYMPRTYIGDGWVVNFADASAKGGGDAPLIYRYGKAVNSKEMMQFASFLLDGKKPPIPTGNDSFRSLESVLSYVPLKDTAPLHKHPTCTWYPQTQFCYLTNQDGMFFASKGGHNNESHNHNDIGTFILYANNTPMLIDAGVGTYTKKTFSKERYTIWSMQTDYHNLPLINGFAQQDGAEYKANDVICDAKKSTFTLDIAGAYPAEAGVEKYVRQYMLKGRTLTIDDKYLLKNSTDYNKQVFMTLGKPEKTNDGEFKVSVGDQTMTVSFPKGWSMDIETVELDDKRLSNIWGNEIYRVVLTNSTLSTSGNQTFKITVK